MGAFQFRHLHSISVPGTVAALLAATAGSYFLLVVGQGVGHHLGRIFIFVPGFVAIMAFACAAGAFTNRLIRRAALADRGARAYLGRRKDRS